MAVARPSALVISPSTEGWFLPSLLARAGWNCDVVSLVDVYSRSACVRSLYHSSEPKAFVDLALRVHGEDPGYAWVVPASDEILGELCARSLLDKSVLPLLPVDAAASRIHLFSKINLSRALDRHGIATPRWAVVRGGAEAIERAESMGYPCFVKRDRSSGGRGTWFCREPAELIAAAGCFEGQAFLLQQAIDGVLWSVEALYWHGQLRAYALSRVLGSIHRFGPSLERRYWADGLAMPGLLPLLEKLGLALSAHGWANISLVTDSALGSPYCIEADLRPNAWIALDQFLGGDFAAVVRDLLAPSSAGTIECYRRQSADLGAVLHAQRLVQMDAPVEQVQQACRMLPDESPDYLEELIRNKFYLRLG